MTPQISRRGFIAGVFGGLVAVGVGVPIVMSVVDGSPTSTGNLLVSRLPRPRAFTRRLTIPPVLRPTRSDADADYYEVHQQISQAEIISGFKTELWTYGGSFPGPTVESSRGRRVVIDYVNDLPLPTVVHLHGGRTPVESDGYPIDYVYPVDRTYYDQQLNDHAHMSSGQSMPGMSMVGDTRDGRRTYTYPLDQRAATLWYHDHRMDFTGASVWRGLAGFHLHRDDEEQALGLPSGSRELPLMIVDRSFDANGALLYPSIDPTLVHTPGVTGDYIAGVLGDVMLVNGTPWPFAEVAGASYRLRFLNASNARRLSLRLDPPPPGGIIEIGTDGGLLEVPIKHDHLVLAPAQRFDVIVDFAGYAPGTVVTLRNDLDSGRMGEVMQFAVGDTAHDSFTLPEQLSTIERLRAEDAVVTRSFQFRAGQVGDMNGWLIGGRPFSPDDISATAALGSVEVWELFADSYHPVHIHLNPFQILQRGANGPGQFDAGWKDTIDLNPGEQARIAIKFDGYPGKYVFHCHNLEHEDMAMMANFETR